MADMPTLAEVRALFHGGWILSPPSEYFDLENQKGSSKFPPGRAPEFYDPFIAFFDERAATAAAQARLDARKGRTDRARQYAELARRWSKAGTVAVMRKQRAMGAPDQAIPVQVTCVWCHPHHVIQDGRQPGSHGMCAEASARINAELDARAHQKGQPQP